MRPLCALTRERVGPRRLETVVGREVDDGALAALSLGGVNGVNEGLADSVGESHDPGINLVVLSHLADVLGGEVRVLDVRLGVTLEGKAVKLARRDVGEVEVGVVVDQVNKVLAGVATGTNQGDTLAGGLSGVAAALLGGTGTEGGASGGREGASVGGGTSEAVGRGRRTDGKEDTVDATVLLKPLNDLLNLLDVGNAVPVERAAGAGERAVSALEVPGTVLVIRGGSPEETLVVLLDRVENVVNSLIEDSVARRKELGHDRSLALGVRDNGDNVEGLVTVDGVGSVLHLGEDLGNGLAAGLDFGVTLGEDLAELGRANTLSGGLLEELVATRDKGTGTGVSEELLLEHVGRDDGDRRGAREGVKELLDLTELELGAELDPRLLHETLVLLVEVDSRELLASDTVEETTLLVEVDNLHGLKDLGELTGGDVGVDVEHLTVGGLGERGEDGETAGADGSLNGSLVNTLDLTDKAVLVLVKVVGVEDTGGDGARTSAETLEGRGELEVLLEEDLTSDLEGLGVGDTDAVLVVRGDALRLEDLVQLRTSTVENDRVEAETVQERKRKREVIKLVGEDSTTDLENSELGLGEDTTGGSALGSLGEDTEVALNLVAGTERVEKTDDSVLSKD